MRGKLAWGSMPVLLRAVVAGLAVAAAGTLPWRLLARWNRRIVPSVPWAPGVVAVYLLVLWKYLGGAGWPRGTSEARRLSLRARPLNGDLWGMSILAGLVGLTALLPLLGIMSRLVRLPGESHPVETPPEMPFVTVFVLLLMGSIVAGVVEEAAFRGYMQGPIERRHGVIVAILVNGVLFGLGHYSHHPESVVAMLPFYLAVTAAYAGLAGATNPILPRIFMHAGGDVFSLGRPWASA